MGSWPTVGREEDGAAEGPLTPGDETGASLLTSGLGSDGPAAEATSEHVLARFAGLGPVSSSESSPPMAMKLRDGVMSTCPNVLTPEQ